MISSPFTKKTLVISVLFSLVIVGLVGFFSVIDDRTKIVFCDVGQGDASYIRVKNQTDVLVDAGPGRQVLSCLGRHMPFYDRKIEIGIITHPQLDHFGGFLYIVDRYRIERIILPPVDNADKAFRRLKNKAVSQKIAPLFLYAQDKLTINGSKLSFLWPTKEFLAKTLIYDRPRQFGNRVLGASSLDLNHFSLVFVFEENGFKVLYTGDATPTVLNSMAESASLSSLQNIDILKIPHHGSKNGLTKNLLKLAEPGVSVISVGKNNPHGHPAKEVLEMLQALKTKIRRTDEEGDIVFKLPN